MLIIKLLITKCNRQLSTLFSYVFSFLSSLVTLLVVSLLLTTTTITKASSLDDLYSAVIIYDETDAGLTREVLIRQAFVKVLYKLTGSNTFLKIKNRNTLIKKSHQLVQKFSTTTFLSEQQKALNKKNQEDADNATKKLANNQSHAENSQTNGVESSPEAENHLKLFRVAFNQFQTNKLLKDNGLSLWLSIRPETLIWLSLEKDNRRTIYSPSTAPKLIKILSNKALERGIPVSFPFVDLKDRQRLSTADLWGNFPDVILSASQRYHTSSILTIRAYQDASGQWLAKWSLYVTDKNINWESRETSLRLLLKKGISSLLINLSDIFKIKEADRVNNSLDIQINNVTSYTDFKRLDTYFSKVSVINNYSLKFAKGDSMIYQVTFVGSKNNFLQNLAWGDLLQRVEESNELDAQTNTKLEQKYKAVILDDDKPEVNETIQYGKPSNQELSTNNQIKADSTLAIHSDQNHKNQITDTSTDTDTSRLAPQAKLMPDVEFWLRD